MARITWLPLHWDEFFDAVDGLPPTLQIGALRVLIHCYRHGIEPELDDDLWISRHAGLERHRGWRGQTAKIRERYGEDNGYLRRFLADSRVSNMQNPGVEKGSNQREFIFIEEKNLNSGPAWLRSLLITSTLDASRRICPGTDLDWLLSAWQQWSATPVTELSDRDAAFLGFCRAHRKRNQPARG